MELIERAGFLASLQSKAKSSSANMPGLEVFLSTQSLK